MFNTHQSAIGAFAQKSPKNMARVYQFVIATVQQSLKDIPKHMKDIDTNRESSINLWGWKSDAWNYSQENALDIYAKSMEIFETSANKAHDLLKFFASLPGLGLAKGGFMIQCCFGLSGCLDSHNVKRFGLSAGRFSAARFKGAKTDATRDKIVAEYHNLVAKCGGCEGLWNDWCNYVAHRQPKNYKDGHAVSAIHLTSLGI